MKECMKMGEPMDMVYTPTSMDANIKVIGRMICNMAKVKKSGQMVLNMKVDTMKVRNMAKENTYGLMADHMKAISKII